MSDSGCRLDADGVAFFSHEFPNFTGQLHAKKPNQNDVGLHNFCLQEVIRFMAEWLKRAVPMQLEALQTLIQMFDATKSQFYKEHGESSLDNCARKQNRRTKGAWGNSGSANAGSKQKGLCPQNISYFLGQGGFNSIIGRIQQGMPLPTLVLLLQILILTKRFWSSGFAAQYIPRVQKATFPRMLACADSELKDLTRSDFDRLMAAMSELLGDVTVASGGAEACDRFRLDFALKLLHCDVLDKKAFGLSLLGDIVERLKPSKRILKSNYIKWLTQEHFTKWLVENRVLEYVMTSNTHGEILRRLRDLLPFCVHSGILTKSHLERLWGWCVSDNDHSARIVGDLLLHLATVLDIEALQFIINLMERVPPASYSADFLALITDFTKESLVNQNKRYDTPSNKLFGLPILWRAFASPQLPRGSGKMTLKEHAQHGLQSLLECHLLESQRMNFLVKCVDNIRTRNEVSSTLGLMSSILQCFPNKKCSDFWRDQKRNVRDQSTTVDMVITELNQKHSLLQMVVQEMVHSKHLKEDPHALKLRLQFLELLLRNSDFLVPKKHALSLWTNFVVEANDGCRLVAEAWFIKAVKGNESDFSAFSDGVCEAIFEEMCSCTPEDFDQHAFDTLLVFFLAVNRNKGSLEVDFQNDDSSKFMVMNRDFTGLKFLWSLAMECEEIGVVHSCAQVLIQLHKNLSSSLSATANEIRRSFVSECLEKAKSASKDSDPARVARSLLVLKSLFAPEGGSGNKDGCHDKQKRVSRSNGELEVTLLLKPKMVQHKCTLSPHQTLGDLKMIAAQVFHHPMRSIQLQPNGQTPVKDNQTPLHTLRSAADGAKKDLIIFVTKQATSQGETLLNRSGGLTSVSVPEMTELVEDNEYRMLYSMMANPPQPKSQKACWEVMVLIRANTHPSSLFADNTSRCKYN